MDGCNCFRELCNVLFALASGMRLRGLGGGGEEGGGTRGGFGKLGMMIV